MFELLKVEKIIIFSKNLHVRIIRASELIEDIRYLQTQSHTVQYKLTDRQQCNAPTTAHH